MNPEPQNQPAPIRELDGGVIAPTDREARTAERRKDSYFHEFRGTGFPQILMGMGELLIPVVVLLGFDDVARDLGLGLLGSLGLILIFTAASFRRAFRRGDTRRALMASREDPVDFAEEVEDHWTDFFRAAALAMVLWAMIPTTRYVIGIEDTLNTVIFILSDVLVGAASLTSLREGLRRRGLHNAIEDGRLKPGGEPVD